MPHSLPVPPVPDLARIEGESPEQAAKWLTNYFNISSAPFNYRLGTKIIRGAYKGLHSLRTLSAGCDAEKSKIGRSANRDVVTLAAPVAFNRNLQVFDLSARRFSFGVDRQAAYRIPFFFVENGIIKVYFLQPRKGAGLDFDAFSMVATIVKKHLLETEFFGERCDIEFVDVSAPEKGNPRILRQYKLTDLNLWPDKRLADRLTLISEALSLVENSESVARKRRPGRKPDADMPLFD